MPQRSHLARALTPALGLAVVTGLVLPASASAAATPDWSAEDVVVDGHLLADPHLTVSTARRSFTVWENLKGSDNTLHFAVRAIGSDRWSHPMPLGVEASEFALVKASGAATLIWRAWSADDITHIYAQHLTKQGLTGERSTVARFGGGSRFELGLAAGASSGGVVTTWTRFGRFYAAFRNANGKWSDPSQLPGSRRWLNYSDVVGAERAFVTASGRPVLIFFEPSGAGVPDDGTLLVASPRADGSWTSRRISPDDDSLRPTVDAGMSVDVTDSGDLVAAWPIAGASGMELVARTKPAGSSWSPVDKTGLAGENVDVTVAGGGNGIEVAHVTQSGDEDVVLLSHRPFEGNTWVTRQVRAAIPSPSPFASGAYLEAAGAGSVVIAAQPSSFGESLRVAVCGLRKGCSSWHRMPHTAGQRHFLTLTSNRHTGVTDVVWQHGCGTEECLAQSLRASVMRLPAAPV